ncbi:hypothetical protein GUITHDRAFT_152624 [Guillardia theta CCMP2712]|uniref:Uncharacterized protein n=1 Tax=Guillardia theta (strain CCMP2712) TaxID=905079 RepID=L1JBR8_GUITC|nr:hypothetical protein GUITHDRAFT_152624 [Guillardia theta CCMP2712]EKX45535.1 hypothetical protein GUITHDRAFT_152624 [Guillardia theta CCMP2712]|eukprot:XP_005832515.1 hypothetical protein GUITHDRAFT_152624 [Guillardia theta CCMP2712]
MEKTHAVVALVLLASIGLVQSFSVNAPAFGLKSCNFATMKCERSSLVRPLRMADEPLYEDDIDAPPTKPGVKQGGISDSMRAKLLKENQALGGDPDAASVNWAVVFAVIIGSLAVVGNLFGAF